MNTEYEGFFTLLQFQDQDQWGDTLEIIDAGMGKSEIMAELDWTVGPWYEKSLKSVDFPTPRFAQRHTPIHLTQSFKVTYLFKPELVLAEQRKWVLHLPIRILDLASSHYIIQQEVAISLLVGYCWRWPNP